MDITEFYTSLPSPTLNRNKYETASHVLSLGYKIISGADAYKSPLSVPVKKFIMENREVIMLPNIFKDTVVGYLLRTIHTKSFRYIYEYPIPYGAGVNDKPYMYPWIIVESCLDADFLRKFYPFVIATLGVSVSNFLMDFLFNTAPYIIVGFDNDEAGNKAYKSMNYKHHGKVLRLDVPFGNKDFGDTLENLQNQNFSQYELESAYIKTAIQNIVG